MQENFSKSLSSLLAKARKEAKNYEWDKVKRRIKFTALTLLCIWLFCFIIFYALIPTNSELPKNKKDAAVVLTGGANRIDMGFRLLEHNLVAALFISGVAKSNKQKNFTYYFEKYGIKDQARVKLGYYARNTEDNAIETKLYLQLKNYENFYLITSSYHTARSWLLFKHLLPEYDFELIPVVSNTYKKYSPKGIYLGLKEYHKCLYIIKDILIEKLHIQYITTLITIADWLKN